MSPIKHLGGSKANVHPLVTLRHAAAPPSGEDGAAAWGRGLRQPLTEPAMRPPTKYLPSST